MKKLQLLNNLALAASCLIFTSCAIVRGYKADGAAGPTSYSFEHHVHDTIANGPTAFSFPYAKQQAEWIDTLRDNYLKQLSDKQIELLKKACRLHTTTMKTGDPTIDACFDADRLDLWRADIIPDPEKMATEKGRQIARNTDYMALME